jgi:hypothetical protein
MKHADEEELEEIYHEEDIVVLDGFDEALLGFAERYNFTSPIAVYDKDVCLSILKNTRNLSEEEAQDFFQANLLGSWFGSSTPVFVTIDPMTEH